MVTGNNRCTTSRVREWLMSENRLSGKQGIVMTAESLQTTSCGRGWFSSTSGHITSSRVCTRPPQQMVIRYQSFFVSAHLFAHSLHCSCSAFSNLLSTLTAYVLHERSLLSYSSLRHLTPLPLPPAKHQLEPCKPSDLSRPRQLSYFLLVLHNHAHLSNGSIVHRAHAWNSRAHMAGNSKSCRLCKICNSIQEVAYPIDVI